MVVGTGDDTNAVGMREVGQLAQVIGEVLGTRHVQLAVRRHEVHLRVYIPENACHSTTSRRGLGLYARPTLADGRPSLSTMSAVKSKLPSLATSEEPTP